MDRSAVVLLSAGLDSTFNLYRAVAEGYDVRAVLTFDYGQRAAKREVACSQKICADLKLPHTVVDLPFFRAFTKTSLVNRAADVPQDQHVKIDDLARSKETAHQVWVPNRNGIFLNVAAGFAEGLQARFVIPGFNFEEAQTFPDNTSDFLKTLDHAFHYSTSSHVKTKCFSVSMNKTEIVQESLKLGVPLKWLWPCYLDGDNWCGQCESCQRFHRANQDANVKKEGG